MTYLSRPDRRAETEPAEERRVEKIRSGIARQRAEAAEEASA